MKTSQKLVRLLCLPLALCASWAAGVWSIGPEPFTDTVLDANGNPVSHFAAFPSALPRRCILAGTSARGVCPKCGEPWVSVVEKGDVGEGYTPGETPDFQVRRFASATPGFSRESKTIGWTPGCECEAGEPVPAVVMDCFAGTGTTLAVALELGRNAIGIELSDKYIELARRRCNKVTPGLPLA